MKKIYVLCLMHFVCAVAGFAQKLRIEDRAPKSVTYPKRLLPIDAKTYEIKSEQRDNAFAINKEAIDKAFVLNSLQKATDADIIVTVKIGKFVLEPKVAVNPIKNDKGQTINYYKATVSFSNPILYEIKDKQGRLITQYNNPADVLIAYETTGLGFNSEKEAKLAASGTATMQGAEKEILKCLPAWGNAMRFNFEKGINMVTNYNTFALARFKASKDNANDTFEKNYLIAENFLKTVTFRAPFDSAKNAIQPVLAYWEKETATLSPENKEHKNMYFACNFNLAVVHTLLEEFEQAEKYLALAEKPDVKDAYIKNMRKYIAKQREAKNNYEQMMKEATAGTYNYYESTFRDATVPTNTPVAGAKLKTSKGYIVRAIGDTLHCVFLDFGENILINKKVSFIQGNEAVQNWDFTQFKSLSIDGYIYDVVDYDICTGLSNVKKAYCAAPNLLQLMYSSPTVTLYNIPLMSDYLFYFPKLREFRRFEPMKKDDGASYITNHHKKLGGVFEHCPKVKDKATEKGYEAKKAFLELANVLIGVIADFEKECGVGEDGFKKHNEALSPEKEIKKYK